MALYNNTIFCSSRLLAMMSCHIYTQELEGTRLPAKKLLPRDKETQIVVEKGNTYDCPKKQRDSKLSDRKEIQRPLKRTHSNAESFIRL